MQMIRKEISNKRIFDQIALILPEKEMRCVTWAIYVMFMNSRFISAVPRLVLCMLGFVIVRSSIIILLVTMNFCSISIIFGGNTEWVLVSASRASSDHRDQTRLLCFRRGRVDFTIIFAPETPTMFL